MGQAPQPRDLRRPRCQENDHFFLYIHYLDPHDYFIPDQRPGSKEAYRRGVERFDRRLGELLDHLEREALLDDALVVLTADHGETLGEPGLYRTGKHFGNPSLWPVLDIPLIVAPAQRDPQRMLRSEDLKGLILSLAGRPTAERGLLDEDELFLAEVLFQTYRRGSWKSLVERKTGAHALIDLTADPGETRDVAALHPEIANRHRERIRELAAALSTQQGGRSELSADDRERLRALGYLEDIENMGP